MNRIADFWFITGMFTELTSTFEVKKYLIEHGFDEEKQKQLREYLNELININYGVKNTINKD
jgi:hypothetical protein